MDVAFFTDHSLLPGSAVISYLQCGKLCLSGSRDASVMLVTTAGVPPRWGLWLLSCVLEGAWASQDPVYSVEGIGLEALQASLSIEILYPDSAFDKKNAVDLNILLWKYVYDILLSEKSNL